MLGQLRAVSRAGEWWEYKLVPIAGVFYATALYLGIPISSLWPAALALLGALVPGAIYVSAVNDLADREEDEAAGKANRMAGRPLWQIVPMVALPVAAGLAFAFHWRSDPPLLLAYLAAWIAFSLYSLRPIRLKARGLAGVIADASGAHLFPSLVAALLVFHQTGAQPDWPWIAAVAAWGAGYGVRGILWHQLHDLANDRAAGVRTFAQRHGPERAAALAHYVAFPLEIAGLAALLWLMGSVAPPLALLVYFILVQRRISFWEMQVVLVRPRPRYLIVMVDYYDVLLPLSVLIASALAHPADLIVIGVHLLLFPNRVRTVADEAWRLRRSFYHLLSRARQNR